MADPIPQPHKPKLDRRRIAILAAAALVVGIWFYTRRQVADQSGASQTGTSINPNTGTPISAPPTFADNGAQAASLGDSVTTGLGSVSSALESQATAFQGFTDALTSNTQDTATAGTPSPVTVNVASPAAATAAGAAAKTAKKHKGKKKSTSGQSATRQPSSRSAHHADGHRRASTPPMTDTTHKAPKYPPPRPHVISGHSSPRTRHHG